MKALKILFWPILLTTLSIYTAMLLWTLPTIQEAAGGLPAFDLRPSGYSYDEAMLFLKNLTDGGRALYIGPQHMLDLIYPAGIALSVGIAIIILAPLTALWRIALALITIPGAAFDHLENSAVTRLLEAKPEDVTAGMVQTASIFTILKSVFDTIAFTVLLALTLLWLYRFIKARVQD